MLYLLIYIRENNTLGLKYYSDMNDALIVNLLGQGSINTENQLVALSDYSRKDYPDTEKCTRAYILFYRGCPNDHGTHVPGPVAQSSAESE